MTQERVLGIIRHSMTFAGGFLVMKGLGDEALIQEITGATLTLIGGVWSIVSKSKSRRR